MDYFTSSMALCAVIYTIYRLALPRPLPGIPYHTSAAQNLLGDIPLIKTHVSNTNGTLITYLNTTIHSLGPPIAQVFLKPLAKPVLLLSDFREAHSLLMVRKDFDRSRALGDLLSGLVPDHHIHLLTDSKWKAQRQLVQDLMRPSYLNDVTGPVIYQKVADLLELWDLKSRIANGKPWAADEDIKLMSLDAMMAFAFGPTSGHNTTKPTIDATRTTCTPQVQRCIEIDNPFVFPQGDLDNVLAAMLDLVATVMELHGSLAPSLHWAYLNRKSRIKKAKKIKDDYITQQLRNGIDRLDDRRGIHTPLTCAVDQMILRERDLATKNGRQPQILTRVMLDELFGFIFAGNETTATTICWAVKFISDSRLTQDKLRTALHKAFPVATSENRDPSIQEIVHSRIPYLDATMEEILRCTGTSPFVNRQAIVDTQILGHHVPRGTIVLCLLSGPSMWSPGFDVDATRRYAVPEQGQSSNKGGRGNKTWNPKDVSSFQPERWLVGDVTGQNDTVQFDATAGPQLAFGLGPRGCFGRRLVYLELRILLTLLIWRFEFLACPEKLSSYASVLKATNEPQQCYIRLQNCT